MKTESQSFTTNPPLMNRLRNWGAALFLGALCLTALIGGCGYGEVSPQTYEIARSIYGVCNRQQTEKLPDLDKLVEESLGEQKINQKEADWLNGIIQQAKDGKWEAAAGKARQIMADQINRPKQEGASSCCKVKPAQS